MSGRCQECRHWLRGDAPYWWARVYPKADPPGLCDHIGDATGDLDRVAAFMSTNGETPWLYTRADFGCTEFAAQEHPE